MKLNTFSPYRYLLSSLAATFCFSCASLSANGDANTLELASPKNDDHFEVNRPMFFWQSDSQAKSYTMVIDDLTAAEIPALSIPIMHFGLTTPLPPGPHHWLVKETTTNGSQNISGRSTFTIDPSENWPDWAIGPFQHYGKNPVISPQGTTWESVNTCNPGVLRSSLASPSPITRRRSPIMSCCLLPVPSTVKADGFTPFPKSSFRNKILPRRLPSSTTAS